MRKSSKSALFSDIFSTKNIGENISQSTLDPESECILWREKILLKNGRKQIEDSGASLGMMEHFLTQKLPNKTENTASWKIRFPLI